MSSTLSPADKIILSPLWLLTLLPLPALYLVSDFLYIIILYVIRYRRAIVYKNLRSSFPEKSSKEIDIIAKKFYRYLCDYFIESVYLLNMNAEECNRRYRFTNPELLVKLDAKKKNIVLAACHYGNWEWANNLNNLSPYKILGVYKPLSNKIFDRLFVNIRGRYGSKPVSMKQTLREVVYAINNDERYALYLVSDQRPGGNDLHFWTTFFNQETPVITGMEKLAQRFDLALVFLKVRRVRRGYYEVTFDMIANEPGRYENNKISEIYIRKVEEHVKAQPEFYLWSHNRWKYSPEKYKSSTP
jgi:Kdo2-lipid IVA lauroyltransferase/acyltransferase